MSFLIYPSDDEHPSVLISTPLYSSAPLCTHQHSSVLISTPLYSSAPLCTHQHPSVLISTLCTHQHPLYSSAPLCTHQHPSVLISTPLYSSAPFFVPRSYHVNKHTGKNLPLYLKREVNISYSGTI